MVQLARANRSRFVKVKCPDCEHEQVVFEKAATVVTCVVCSKILAEPTGGKAKVNVEILETFE